MKKIQVSIAGKLLMTAQQQEEEGKRKKKTFGPEDAKKRLYFDDDGNKVFPSTYITAVLREAGKNFKYEGKKSYMNMIRAMIRVNPLWIKITPQENEVYESFVRIPPRTGARVKSFRPLFKDWSASFDVTILDDDLAPEQIKEILQYGGSFLGVGDGRPEFGQFEVASFEVKQ